ncbi:MAG: hypothetical protein ABIO76_03230 [Ginsengibacter sp.]
MKKISIVFILFVLIVGCGNKKIKLADNDKVEITDFVEFFPEVALPFKVDNAGLSRSETDSSSIGYKIFTQFIPDSVLRKEFGQDTKLKIYPLGRVAIEKFETYLFIKVISSSKKVGYVMAFNNDNKYIAALPLVVEDKGPSVLQAGSMDKKYTVTQSTQTKRTNGEFVDIKNVYILNSDAEAFSKIMTDQGIAEQEREIINPIDTLPRKNKFSGDYIKDKRNYVSIRDGKKPSDLLFFIHFEKDNGECIGELKGTAQMHGIKTALYHAIGNPCVLELNLKPNSVSLKEVEACGSYMDIKCFFDGSFVKKKEAKTKTSSGKKR